MAVHDLFLSCVSNEFHKDAGHGFISYRDDLAARLRNAGFHVEVQENFSEHGGDLLQKLEAYIKDCRVVIHLVGDMTGAVAKLDEVHALLQRCPDFLSRRPALRAVLGGCVGLSYTQWEALFALHHERPLLRYQAAATAPRSPKYESIAAQKASQRTHWDRLKDSGLYPGTFTSQENLCMQVFEALHREHLFDGITSSGYHGIHNLPFGTLGTLFKGREDFMRDLRATLTGGVAKAAAIVQGQRVHSPRPAAIHALGGIGKTRAAIEYAWQHAHEYDALLFISAPTKDQLESGIAALTGPLVLNLPEQSAREQQVQYDASLRWLHQHSRWFLILDNVDSEAARSAVTALLAHLSRGHVCITSRLSQWPGSVKPLDIQVLSDDAGAAFLLERTASRRSITSDDETSARQLVQRLDGLALALEQAGAYISRLHLSFPQYLERLATNAAQVHSWSDATQMDYPKSVAETWLTTFQQLQPAERDLLHTLAWFDAQPIPLWLVEPQEEGADSKGHELKQRSTRELLATLADWHFVTFSDDGLCLKLHRLVQEVTLLHLVEEEARTRALTQALQWLNQVQLGDPNDTINWPCWDAVQVHALRLARYAGKEQQWVAAVNWQNQIARLMAARALFTEAELFYWEALAIAVQHLQPDHIAGVDVVSNLAGLLYSTNRLAEAEPMLRHALAVSERCYGIKHTIVATHLNNLALLLQTKDQLVEAEMMFRQALTIDENIYEPDHPIIAVRLNNLAGLLRVTNRLREAELLYRRALAVDESHYGEAHSKVAFRINNLAVVLGDSNRPVEAEMMLRRALAINEKNYGKEHPHVAVNLNNLAMLLQVMGRRGEAEILFRRALSISERSYGVEHPDVGNCLNNLALLLQAENRLIEAEPMFRRALHIFEKSYGLEHPDVATSINNLAELLRITNRLVEAESIFQRALRIFEKSYGPQHPRVATGLNNLALLLKASEREAEAEPMYQRALAILEQSYGPQHPDVANTLVNLSSMLHELGRSGEALPLIKRAVDIYQRSGEQQGYEHPSLATAQNWLEGIQQEVSSGG